VLGGGSSRGRRQVKQYWPLRLRCANNAAEADKQHFPEAALFGCIRWRDQEPLLQRHLASGCIEQFKNPLFYLGKRLGKRWMNLVAAQQVQADRCFDRRRQGTGRQLESRGIEFRIQLAARIPPSSAVGQWEWRMAQSPKSSAVAMRGRRPSSF
jgi:hypothetical protein